MAFAFSGLLYPLLHRFALRLVFPTGVYGQDSIGLTQLIVKEKRTSLSGVFLPKGTLVSLPALLYRPSVRHTVLVAACQPLAPYPDHEMYNASH